MSPLLIGWLVALLGLVGSLICLQLLPSAALQWRELLLPEETTADQVCGLLAHIAGIRSGPVVIRVQALPGRVRFLVAAPGHVLDSVLAAGSGILADAQFVEVEAPSLPESANHVVAARVAWGGPWPLLRDRDPEAAVTGLLGVLASVNESDQLELQLRLWPVGRVNRPVASSERSQAPVNPWFMRAFWPAQPPREDIRAIRAKYSGLLLRSELFAVASSPTEASANAAVHRLVAALRTTGGSRGVLRYRAIHGQDTAEQVIARRRPPLPWESSTVLSPDELVGLSALPVGSPRISGVTYGVAPRLMAPHGLPSQGRVFARSNSPQSMDRLLAQPVVGGLQHAVLVGPTGSGKSTMVANLVRADLAAGRGAFVLDLKGDLVSDLLAAIPDRRRHDVIVLEPAGRLPQPGLQLFPKGGDVELTSDLILGTLQELFRDSWGTRSSQYLGLGLRTLGALPGATLPQLPRLFSDRAFRAEALELSGDVWLRDAWQRFAGLSAADQAAQLSSPLTKLEELVGRARLRLVLGQADSKLDFRRVLADQRVVLVSLPPGLLGMPATRLLAALTLWQLFQAVEARAALPDSERRPFMAYIDEVAVLANLPLPLDSLFERARSHGVGLTVSPQALSQLQPELRASLLANVGTLVAFAQRSETEAKPLARALGNLTPAQLQHLGQYEVALRLGLGPGSVTPVMTGRTLPPDSSCSDPASIRQQAAERWGHSLSEVDATLRRGTGSAAGGIPPTPRLGVTRRSQ